MHCGHPNIRALDRMIRTLFACHRRSLVRNRVIGDQPCELQAIAVHDREVAQIDPACGRCYSDFLGIGARTLTTEAIRTLFCMD